MNVVWNPANRKKAFLNKENQPCIQIRNVSAITCPIIRLDEYEHDLIQALTNYTGEQPSILLRQMAMMQAEETLCLHVTERITKKAV